MALESHNIPVASPTSLPPLTLAGMGLGQAGGQGTEEDLPRAYQWALGLLCLLRKGRGALCAKAFSYQTLVWKTRKQ